MKNINEITDSFTDGCGVEHHSGLDAMLVGDGVLSEVPAVIAKYGKKPFLLSDPNEWEAAGKKVASILESSGIPFSSHVFAVPDGKRLMPDELAAGELSMHYDKSCDVIVGIGSGVVNDLGKLLASLTGHDYIIIGTAPSMDGFASATSSMDRDGLKQSLQTVGAKVVIGDTDILSRAPSETLAAGVGDMVAKYISLVEWKISNIINGEYYCPNVASIVRDALDIIVDNVDALASRDKNAVGNVMRGLVLSGVAMNYTGISRPASGVEHYFSHIFDMRGLEFGTPTSLHGIQCGVATLISLKIYEKLAKMLPDREKALSFARKFDKEKWYSELKSHLGKSALPMITIDERDKRYDLTLHEKRLNAIIAHWDEIVSEMNKLPSYGEVERVLKTVGSPTTAEELDQPSETVRFALRAAKDIRGKYTVSNLLWDLGLIEEF